MIEGSANTISTPSPQQADNTTYDFSGWSDGQSQTHNATPTTNTTYTARFAPLTPGTSTLTFDPEADAQVDQASPTTNFGGLTTLRTDAGGNPGVESYLRFLVGGVTAKVQSAKLRLFSTSSTVDGPAAYPTSSTWTESGINWNNKPAATGGAAVGRRRDQRPVNGSNGTSRPRSRATGRSASAWHRPSPTE